MPCYRCGARQTDPGKGPSPWKRGVVDDQAVLVCPDCQRSHNWTDDLDRCASCGSTMLIRALGETRCRQCEWVRRSPAEPAVDEGTGGDPRLSEEVEQALRRRFGG
jgi:hypothetical protein